MGKSKSEQRNKKKKATKSEKRNKKNKAAAAAAGELVAGEEIKDFYSWDVKLLTSLGISFVNNAQYQCGGSGIYSTRHNFAHNLAANGIQREETTLLDQTPVLTKILDYYGGSKPSATDIVSELSPLDSNNHVLTRVKRKGLRAIYSTISTSIVSVSSFFGVERKIDCSGVIIDWSSTENEATILTSAKLLSAPKDFNDQFEFHIIVRTADGTLLLAKEHHVDYYHNLLTLKVKSIVELKVLDLISRQSDDIFEGLSVIALGRSFYTYSLCDFTGGELYQEHPSFGCDELLRSTCRASVICEGGPLITDAGYVVGINFFGNRVYAQPLPTAVILGCLEMWRSFSTIVRPWFGMSVVDVDQLSYRIWEKLDISLEESCVAVKEVFEGSIADKNNVRPYDVVATLNGTPIRSAKQYSQLLCETSRAATGCGDSSQHGVTQVVINPFDRRTYDISIEADYVSVDDKRFSDCWPQVEADEWSHKKFRSQNNPAFYRPQASR